MNNLNPINKEVFRQINKYIKSVSSERIFKNLNRRNLNLEISKIIVSKQIMTQLDLHMSPREVINELYLSFKDVGSSHPHYQNVSYNIEFVVHIEDKKVSYTVDPKDNPLEILTYEILKDYIL